MHLWSETALVFYVSHRMNTLSMLPGSFGVVDTNGNTVVVSVEEIYYLKS